MDPSLAKLIWLVGLIGFGFGVAFMLMKVDRNDAWKKAHVAQLVLNRHGGLDLPAVAFWVTMMVNVFVLVFCLFKGQVPERFDIMLGAFNIAFVGPVVAKIFKGGTNGGEPPTKSAVPIPES